MARNKSISKRQKREKKKKIDKKIDQEVKRLKREEEIKREAEIKLKQEEILKKQSDMHLAGTDISKHDPNAVSRINLNFAADKNGCGYFRCIWPFELLSTYKNKLCLNTFVYQLDDNVLRTVDTMRFQRQATDSQLGVWNMYLSMKKQGRYNYNLQYELDDNMMEIEETNKIAYDFFDAKKKQNHLYMLNSADSVTFSTQALKDIYVNDYGIDAEKIKVVKNHLPQFMYSLPYRNSTKDFTKEKPRIFWSGSASHLGKGGDLEFILPLIEKTVDEYQWVFQGTVPPELSNYVKSGQIEFLPWVPIYGLANIQFYKARPDIYLAPLKPNRFNTCKSDLKYLEACALGAPCITTSFQEQGLISPYDDANAEICIEPDADIWKTMIDHLISDPDYYIDVVKNQYEFLNGRWMENNLKDWEDVL